LVADLSGQLDETLDGIEGTGNHRGVDRGLHLSRRRKNRRNRSLDFPLQAQLVVLNEIP